MQHFLLVYFLNSDIYSCLNCYLSESNACCTVSFATLPVCTLEGPMSIPRSHMNSVE